MPYDKEDDPAVDPQGGRENPGEHGKSKLKDRPVAHPDDPVDSQDDIEGGHNADADQ